MFTLSVAGHARIVGLQAVFLKLMAEQNQLPPFMILRMCSPAPVNWRRMKFSSVNDSACADILDMMCADVGFHADQARRHIGEPRFHLAPRPLVPQHDGAARIGAHDVERVLADIDADYGDRGIGYLGHGVLLVFGAPCQLRLLAGQEHGRTIPLADIASRSATACLSSATIPTWWAWGLIQSVVLISTETTCRSVW